jgi:hypothetical protein
VLAVSTTDGPPFPFAGLVPGLEFPLWLMSSASTLAINRVWFTLWISLSSGPHELARGRFWPTSEVPVSCDEILFEDAAPWQLGLPARALIPFPCNENPNSLGAAFDSV